VYTEIFHNPSVRAMRAMALQLIDRVEFRHHGIGVLQGYVLENTEPEIRIHIWSRALLKEGIDISGDVHDHRFDMVSHVLHGAVVHEELNETPDPAGEYTMMSLTHARAAAATDYHGPTRALDGRYSVKRDRYVICAGSSYKFPQGKFHHSPLHPATLAITVVEKHCQSEVPARLLYPVGKEPVMAFGHRPHKDLIGAVLSTARNCLRGML